MVSQTQGAKVLSQKKKSSDPQLRSKKDTKLKKMMYCYKMDVGLRAATF